MNSDLIEQLKSILARFSTIKVAYLFGSQANGTAGPLSDYDIAIYTDAAAPSEDFKLRIDIANAVSKELKTDAVEVLSLNSTESPELKFAVIRDGILLKEVEPFKVMVEPKIMNEYFDFREGLRRNNLTKA